MPFQEKIFGVLENYLKIHRGPAFTVLPPIELNPDHDICAAAMNETPGEWGQRCHKSRMQSRKAKTWRVQG